MFWLVGLGIVAICILAWKACVFFAVWESMN
jgi:hypothetical protein